MTHDQLIAKIIDPLMHSDIGEKFQSALRAVVELHRPMWNEEYCGECHPDHNGSYPCSTIQAIEKALN